MRWTDPIDTIALDLPSGWALDPLSSSLTTLVFTCWIEPAPRSLFVSVRPTASPGSDDEWCTAVRSYLPGEIGTPEYTVSPPTVWARRPRAHGGVDQRWAIVRGARLDVVLEELDVPLGGPMRTPLLALAVRTLQVPANGQLKVIGGDTYSDLMRAAAESIRKGNWPETEDWLVRVLRWASGSWLRDLCEGKCSVEFAIAAGHSLIQLFGMSHRLTTLDEATVLAARCQQSADGERRYQADRLLTVALEEHGRWAAANAPIDAFRALRLRASIGLNRFLADMPGDKSSGLTVVAAALQAIAAQFVVATFLIGTGSAAGQQVAHAFRLEGLRILTAAGQAVLETIKDTGKNPPAALMPEHIAACRELARLDPTPATVAMLVLALTDAAVAFSGLADEQSTTVATELIAEARALLEPKLPDGPQLASDLCLASAWNRYRRKEFQAALEEADRCMVAFSQGRTEPDDDRTRSVQAVRSAALIALGNPVEALAAAHAANAPEDPYESAHRAALAGAFWANDQPVEAVEQAQKALAAALTEYPFANIVSSILELLTEALNSIDDPLALQACRIAADLTYYRARWLPAPSQEAQFGDVPNRRRATASLVLLLLRSGDATGALAAAENARARSLTAAWSAAPPSIEVPSAVTVTRKTSLAELLTTLEGLLREALESVNVPPAISGEQLTAWVERSERVTLLLHPTQEGLVRFLLRPRHPLAVDVVPITQESLARITSEIHRRLAITVVTRSLPDLRAGGDLNVKGELAAWAAEANEEPGDDDSELTALLDVLGTLLLTGLSLDRRPLAIVPYRELAVIPTAALTGSSPALTPLIRPLSVMPSIRSVLNPSRRPVKPSPGRARAVVVGDPVTDPTLGLQALDGALKEARIVASRLRVTFDVTELIGPAATEEKLREHAGGARILHLACHAAVREPVATSALFLAPGPYDDGSLMVAEAEDLGLDDALVVLAACESGLGRVTPDGVEGLGHAFLLAGAASVVLSLWPVSDISTQLLMRRFYRELLAPKPADAARALVIAQRATMRRYPSVAHWAPWLLVGDGGWRANHSE